MVLVLLQLSHHQEKLTILQQSLTATQEELSAKVGELVRLEQTQRMLDTELITMKDRVTSYDDEIAKQNQTIGNDCFSFASFVSRVWYDAVVPWLHVK